MTKKSLVGKVWWCTVCGSNNLVMETECGYCGTSMDGAKLGCLTGLENRGDLKKSEVRCLHHPSYVEENSSMFSFVVIDNKTGEEVDQDKVIREEWARALVYADPDGFALLDTGDLIMMDSCGNYVYCPPGRFSVFVHLNIS